MIDFGSDFYDGVTPSSHEGVGFFAGLITVMEKMLEESEVSHDCLVL